MTEFIVVYFIGFVITHGILCYLLNASSNSDIKKLSFEHVMLSGCTSLAWPLICVFLPGILIASIISYITNKIKSA